MKRKVLITFLAIMAGAGAGYLGSCVARSEGGKVHAAIAPQHQDAALSHEHQLLMDVVERQRAGPAPQALLKEEKSGSSPRQGG